MNIQNTSDYTSYPNGFSILVSNLELPINNKTNREVYTCNLLEILVKN